MLPKNPVFRHVPHGQVIHRLAEFLALEREITIHHPNRNPYPYLLLSQLWLWFLFSEAIRSLIFPLCPDFLFQSEILLNSSLQSRTILLEISLDSSSLKAGWLSTKMRLHQLSNPISHYLREYLTSNIF